MSSILKDQIEVQQESSEPKYFSLSPYIVNHLNISANAYRLYGTLKEICSFSPSTFLSNEQLADWCGLKMTSFKAAKKELAQPLEELNGKSLITLTLRKKEGTKENLPTKITLNNIWGENNAYMYKKYHPKGSPPDSKNSYVGQNTTEGRSVCDQLNINRDINIKKNKAKKKNSEPPLPKTGAKPPVSSPAAHRLSVFLFEKLKEKHPPHKEPHMNKWAIEMDKIMRIDKRSEENLKEVITWAFAQQDDFWPTIFQSPKTLRKMYDRARIKINHKSPTTIRQDHTEKNKEVASKAAQRINAWSAKEGKNIAVRCNGSQIEICAGASVKGALYFSDLGFSERLRNIFFKIGMKREEVFKLIC